MPSIETLIKQAKLFWKLLGKFSPLIAVVSILLATGVLSKTIGLINYETATLLIFILHVVALTIVYYKGFNKINSTTRSFFVDCMNTDLFIKSGIDMNTSYDKARYIYKRVTNYWRQILLVWFLLYTWFLFLVGIDIVNDFTVEMNIQSMVFNIFNNAETVLIILSLSYLVRGWRVIKHGENKLAPFPTILIGIVVFLALFDIALKLTLNQEAFNYSSVLDFIFGIFTGVAFGYFVSILNSRFIRLPNVLIIILFLYCCLMTVYPVLEKSVLFTDYISTSKIESKSTMIATINTVIQPIMLGIFGIALLGKLIIIQLFYFKEYSIKFFLYIMSLQTLEQKFYFCYKRVLVNIRQDEEDT